MNTTSAPHYPADEQREDTRVINLRVIFDVLRHRWQEIVLAVLGVTVLTAAGVLLYRQLTPPIYEATATAAIVRTVTTVQLDERFTTASDELGAAGGSLDARREALVALASSGAIAQQVIDELGDQLPPELQNATALLEQVTVRMGTATGSARQSDLIQISARADSPQLATAIADAWVKAYVQQVNSIYGQAPDDMLTSVETQLAQAQTAYEQVQGQLETFLSTSQLNALTRKAQTVDSTIRALEQSKVDALNSYMSSLGQAYANIAGAYVTAQAQAQVLAFNKTQQGEQARVAAYFDAYNAAQVDPFTTQRDRLLSELRLYNDQWLRTNSLLAAARTLQAQVASGAMDPANSALALQVLNLQLVNAASQVSPSLVSPSLATNTQGGAAQNTTTEPPALTALQIQLDGSGSGAGTDAAGLGDQVDAIVASLESQAQGMERNIAELKDALLSGDSFGDLNGSMPADSALVQAIGAAYPRLFQSNVLTDTAFLAQDSALLAAGQAQASQFLGLVEDSALPTSDAPTAPLSASIAQLEEQQRVLQGQIEVESARRQQITQQRDIAWESVKALSNKQAELQLARATGNSEVRISGAAVPLDVAPVSLLRSVALAAAVGLLLGLALAFVLEFMNAPSLRAGASKTNAAN